ncbi:MAG: hypothetical protein AUF76_17925 [Acidobacteria bacterium 13_1_20CM_2_65_9]|nr:MAG: hypothetical protein AUF76_17925 [Acidobacteria bacterium 13_1_20CM_2_65_9]
MNQPFQFGRARLRLHGVRFGGHRMRLGFLSLALLMDEKDERQDQQRRDQRQTGGLFHVTSQIQKVPNGTRKNDNDSNCKADQKEPVLPSDEIHWIEYFSATPQTR